MKTIKTIVDAFFRLPDLLIGLLALPFIPLLLAFVMIQSIGAAVRDLIRGY